MFAVSTSQYNLTQKVFVDNFNAFDQVFIDFEGPFNKVNREMQVYQWRSQNWFIMIFDTFLR